MAVHSGAQCVLVLKPDYRDFLCLGSDSSGSGSGSNFGTSDSDSHASESGLDLDEDTRPASKKSKSASASQPRATGSAKARPQVKGKGKQHTVVPQSKTGGTKSDDPRPDRRGSRVHSYNRRKSIKESKFATKHADLLKPVYKYYQAMQFAVHGANFQWEACHRVRSVRLLLDAAKQCHTPEDFTVFKKAVEAELLNDDDEPRYFIPQLIFQGLL